MSADRYDNPPGPHEGFGNKVRKWSLDMTTEAVLQPGAHKIGRVTGCYFKAEVLVVSVPEDHIAVERILVGGKPVPFKRRTKLSMPGTRRGEFDITAPWSEWSDEVVIYVQLGHAARVIATVLGSASMNGNKPQNG